MSNLKNSITLMGHLGADPEFKQLENGKKLVKLRLATNEVYKNKNGDKVSDTQWHNCIAWGKQAELIHQYLSKGKEGMIRGKLTNRSYEDKNGVNKNLTEVIINEFSFVGKKTAV